MKDMKAGKKTREDYARLACETWYDVRAFGQVFAFKKGKKRKKNQTLYQSEFADLSVFSLPLV